MIYSQRQNFITESHFMKQNADFQEGISEAESPAKPLLNPKLLTINESFQMRYYIGIFLKGRQNGQRRRF